MERLREITRFWNWLPAFRAVGETQHLPSASEQLGVVPSSLSRSITQLEKAVGVPLFRRDGRRLELDERGQRFLIAVRDAMRLVHEGLLDIRGEELTGVLHIVSSGVVTTAHLLPAIAELQRANPELVVRVDSDLHDVVPRLLSGRLDLAFASEPIVHPRLWNDRLGLVRAGIYCGPDHPLHGVTKVRAEDLAEHPFVAPPPGDDGLPIDGWPAHLRRHCTMLVDQMRVGCAAALTSRLLVVLPEPIAVAYGEGALHRLPVDVVPSTEVHVATRTPITKKDRIRVVVEMVRARIASAD